jgi:hypothetical protein
MANFLESNKSIMELGFWSEEYLSMLKLGIEIQYKTEVIREWYVADIVINGDKVLVKWKKRLHPLSDEQLNEKYNRVV